ncbi:MAG: hypothetical protein ABI476_00700 [Oxalobacteraceae bacterium]
MANRTPRFFPPIKIFSMVVLALMVLAAGYAAVISISNWSGISV